MRPGLCSHAVLSIAPVAVVLFFVSVNQVLLRLWTRVMDICPWGNSWVYENPVVRSIVLTGLVVRKNGAPLGQISEWSETCERFYSTAMLVDRANDRERIGWRRIVLCAENTIFPGSSSALRMVSVHGEASAFGS